MVRLKQIWECYKKINPTFHNTDHATIYASLLSSSTSSTTATYEVTHDQCTHQTINVQSNNSETINRYCTPQEVNLCKQVTFMDFLLFSFFFFLCVINTSREDISALHTHFDELSNKVAASSSPISSIVTSSNSQLPASKSITDIMATLSSQIYSPSPSSLTNLNLSQNFSKDLSFEGIQLNFLTQD